MDSAIPELRENKRHAQEERVHPEHWGCSTSTALVEYQGDRGDDGALCTKLPAKCRISFSGWLLPMEGSRTMLPVVRSRLIWALAQAEEESTLNPLLYPSVVRWTPSGQCQVRIQTESSLTRNAFFICLLCVWGLARFCLYITSFCLHDLTPYCSDGDGKAERDSLTCHGRSCNG